MQIEGGWTGLCPELILAAFIGVLWLIEAGFWPRRSGVSMGYLALCGCLVVLALSLSEWRMGGTRHGWNRTMVVDPYSTFFDVFILCGAALSLLLSLSWRKGHSERYILLLSSALGGMLAAGATDLIVVFLGLEMSALSLHVLFGLSGRAVSDEAAIKHYLSGGLASAFFLFGTSLIYGATGSTSLQALVAHLRDVEAGARTLVYPGMGLLLVGLSLRIGLVPFHMWVPDVSQGGATGGVAFLSMGSKIAALAVLVRLSSCGLEGMESILWALSAATMVGGALLALNQRGLGRRLACYGISHYGFALIGIAGAGSAGVTGAVFYLSAMSMMHAGGLAVLALCRRREGREVDLNEYRGIGKRHPWLGGALALLLLGMSGMPPMAGFWGRLYLLNAVVRSGRFVLGGVAVITGLLEVYGHLGVILELYGKAEERASIRLRLTPEALAVLLLAVLATLGLGVWPAPLLDAARFAVSSLLV